MWKWWKRLRHRWRLFLNERRYQKIVARHEAEDLRKANAYQVDTPEKVMAWLHKKGAI